MYALAQLYETNQVPNVPPGSAATLAVRYYAAAANKGHGGAHVSLAERYYCGDGVARDFAMAYQHYRASAAAGEVVALYCLAEMCGQGLGVVADPDKAREYYRAAVETEAADTHPDEAAARLQIAAATLAASKADVVGSGLADTKEILRLIDAVATVPMLQRSGRHPTPVVLEKIASLYEFGFGVPVDAAAAVTMYRASMSLGNTNQWVANRVASLLATSRLDVVGSKRPAGEDDPAVQNAAKRPALGPDNAIKPVAPIPDSTPRVATIGRVATISGRAQHSPVQAPAESVPGRVDLAAQVSDLRSRMDAVHAMVSGMAYRSATAADGGSTSGDVAALAAELAAQRAQVQAQTERADRLERDLDECVSYISRIVQISRESNGALALPDGPPPRRRPKPDDK